MNRKNDCTEHGEIPADGAVKRLLTGTQIKTANPLPMSEVEKPRKL